MTFTLFKNQGFIPNDNSIWTDWLQKVIKLKEGTLARDKIEATRQMIKRL